MKKMNNKGFSLVELIVVIAIMAILAVTLAPRLTQYVEKARRASDEEVVNAIYTAVRLGVLDDDIRDEAVTLASAGFDLKDADEGLYESADGKSWTFLATYNDGDNAMLDEIKNVVGEFKLKSNAAVSATTITVKVPDADNVSVELNYAGTGDADYIASDKQVRP